MRLWDFLRHFDLIFLATLGYLKMGSWSNGKADRRIENWTFLTLPNWWDVQRERERWRLLAKHKNENLWCFRLGIQSCCRVDGMNECSPNAIIGLFHIILESISQGGNLSHSLDLLNAESPRKSHNFSIEMWKLCASAYFFRSIHLRACGNRLKHSRLSTCLLVINQSSEIWVVHFTRIGVKLLSYRWFWFVFLSLLFSLFHASRASKRN